MTEIATNTLTPAPSGQTRLRPFSLVRYNKAYQSYRRFKSVPKERLEDMGLAPSDQGKAQFVDFLKHL